MFGPLCEEKDRARDREITTKMPLFACSPKEKENEKRGRKRKRECKSKIKG